MTITKQNLLKQTGISYGQLYRWKRVGLIPESWFIKQSSYTGQETIFPREKILERIQVIQELKDSYSLEEMAAMLSPEAMKNAVIEESVLLNHQIIKEKLLVVYKKTLNKQTLQYVDIVMLYALENQVMPYLDIDEVERLLKRNNEYFARLQGVERTIAIMRINDDYIMVAIDTMVKLYIDSI